MLAQHFGYVAHQDAATAAAHSFTGNAFRGPKTESSAAHCDRVRASERQGCGSGANRYRFSSPARAIATLVLGSAPDLAIHARVNGAPPET